MSAIPHRFWGLPCPKCHHEESCVVDTRCVAHQPAIRRRRQCDKCGHRWSTYEQTAAPLHEIRERAETLAKLMKTARLSLGEVTDHHERLQKLIVSTAAGE